MHGNCLAGADLPSVIPGRAIREDREGKGTQVLAQTQC